MNRSPGTYSLVNSTFDMSRATLKAAPRVASFTLLYNGTPIGEHASASAAEAAIDHLSRFCNTSRACFAVKEQS